MVMSAEPQEIDESIDIIEPVVAEEESPPEVPDTPDTAFSGDTQVAPERVSATGYGEYKSVFRNAGFNYKRFIFREYNKQGFILTKK